MKMVFNPFTGTLDFVGAIADATPVTDSIDTESEAHLTTEAGDLLIPES